jgi:adenosyl cobinamide kinase/adenosyl cobinamide phosphate guanylyltransferase
MENIKLARAVSVSNLLNKKYELLDFKGEWYDAYRQPCKHGVWLVKGDSGNGKTSFALQLVKCLAELDLKVDYLSMEEGDDHTMQLAVETANLKDVKGRFKILLPESPEHLSLRLKKHRSADVVIIDTVQYWCEMYKFSFKQFLELKKAHPNKLFVFFSHVKNGVPDGSVANKIYRDASLKIDVTGFRAISKGRYIGKKGFYTVWDEGADEYWGNV